MSSAGRYNGRAACHCPARLPSGELFAGVFGVPGGLFAASGGLIVGPGSLTGSLLSRLCAFCRARHPRDTQGINPHSYTIVNLGIIPHVYLKNVHLYLANNNTKTVNNKV